ncbi:MAG: PAS domain-containing protein [Anaerolineaceae bacterium]|nr:MAG: PAS domain-containing protein [Anaerolineaceae bacterium]
MPIDSLLIDPISRFFKPGRYRDYFQVLVDALDLAVLVISSDDYNILACNRAFLLLTGYSRAELDELALLDLLGEASDTLLPQLLDCSQKSDSILEEMPILTHSGEVVVIDFRILSTGKDQTELILLGTPASERIQVMDRRLAEEQRLETMINISRLIIDEMVTSFPSVLDLARRLLCSSSTALYRVSASSPSYILEGSLPHDFPETLPGASFSPLQRITLWTLGQRPDHELHKAARSSNFGALHTALIGDPAAWVGLLVVGWEDEDDIPDDTDLLISLIANICHLTILLSLQRASVAEGQKEIEQLQAEALDQFSSIGDTLITLDDELKVINANPAIGRTLGYQPDEVVGLPIQDVLISPEDVTSILLDALGHHRVAEQTRITLHRRDGTPFPVHLRASPFSDQALSRLMIVLKDQSEQQKIEDQTEMLAQRALLGEVSAIFAHEVRNPINNISTGVQLVASRLGTDHPLHDSLEKVRNECNRLDQLMSDVLLFARPLKLNIEPISLADLMERILSRWSPHFRQVGVQCHTSYEPETPDALADERTLERVIVNLITNALQAMEDGGTLSVNLGPLQSSQGDMVELKIIDTGPGIPPDVQDRIFDPFFTTKKEGTGLGLAIGRRILSAHRGTIQVESYPDAGTVFTISLPAASEDGGSDL